MFSNVDLKYQLIAHRANSGKKKRAENSLSAVRATHDEGIEWVECDVLLTKNNVVIVLHDETLARTTRATAAYANKSISELSYDDIIQFDLINESPEHSAAEKVPTLIQFLQLIKELNMGLLLEIKAVAGFERLTAQKTVEILEQCGFIDYPKLIVQSFLVECLQEVKLRNNKIPRALLLDQWEALTRVATGNILRYPTIYACKESIEEILSELQCIAVAINHAILNEERVMYLKEKLRIPLLFTWTVNTPEKALALYQLGVDSIISDAPLLILQQSNQMQQVISKELSQFQIPQKPVDIVINYLGLFNYNARQEKRKYEADLPPAKKQERSFSYGV